jgi:hypothetical protein
MTRIRPLAIFSLRSSAGGQGYPAFRWHPQASLAAKGRGKRGGLRILYFWWVSADRISMLMIYAKNETENLTVAQLAKLKKGAGSMKNEIFEELLIERQTGRRHRTWRTKTWTRLHGKDQD